MNAPSPPVAIAVVVGSTFAAQASQKSFSADKAFRPILAGFLLGGALYAFNSMDANFGAAATWLVIVAALLVNGVPAIAAVTRSVR